MDHPEDIYVSTSEFKAHLRHYKELAKTCVIHVTEHGHAGYVFLSVEVFEQRKAEACHRARWQVQAEASIAEGLRNSEKWFDLAPRTDIEYVGQSWDNCIAPCFDDDIRRRKVSEEDLSLVRQCLSWLADDPHAGRPIDVGPEARLPFGAQAFRLNAGTFDIIYSLIDDDELRVCGLIEAL